MLSAQHQQNEKLALYSIPTLRTLSMKNDTTKECGVPLLFSPVLSL